MGIILSITHRKQEWTFSMDEKLYIEVMGNSLVLTDGDGTGIRVLGPKQWGGATTDQTWELTESAAKDFLGEIHHHYPHLFSEFGNIEVCNV